MKRLKCEQLRQEVNDLFAKPNTQNQVYLATWKKLKPLTPEIFESIWGRVSDSPFSYEDCALEGTVMKRGQEQHGFKRGGRNYYSMREGQKHGLSVEINGWPHYYYIYVHNNGEEVFCLRFN